VNQMSEVYNSRIRDNTIQRCSILYMYTYVSRVFGGNTRKNQISSISRISDEDLHWYARKER